MIKDKVSLKSWMLRKPYPLAKGYDHYYKKLSNQVHKLLYLEKNWLEDLGYDERDLVDLAISLTSYFEDFINEIGIWNAYVKYNKREFGYYLPFYDLSDYDTEYLNPQDFSFLIWLHNYRMTKGKWFIASNSPAIMRLGNKVYNFLEKQIDDAKTTDFYEDFFKIEDDIEFFELKRRLDWFALSSYAIGSEFNFEMSKEVRRLMEADSEGFSEFFMEHMNEMMYTMRDDYIYSKRSTFSAWSTIEWFVEVMDASSDTKAAILELRKRIMIQPFVIEDFDDEFYTMKLEAINRVFKVNAKSINLPEDVKPGNSIALATLVSWKGEWWVSGMSSFYPNDEEAKGRKEDEVPYYAYSLETQQIGIEVTELMYETFVEFFGAEFIYCVDRFELTEKYNDYNRAYSKANAEKNKLDFSEKEILRIDESMFMNMRDGIIFAFHKKIGIIIEPEMDAIIERLQKDELDKAKNEHKILYYDIFRELPEFISEGLMKKFGTHNLSFPMDNSEIDVVKYRKFLYRFLNPSEYGLETPKMQLQ